MLVRVVVVCGLGLVACGGDDGGSKDAAGEVAADGTAGDATVATDGAIATETSAAETSAPSDTGATEVAEADTAASSDTASDADGAGPSDVTAIDATAIDTTAGDAPVETDAGPGCLGSGYAVGEIYVADDHCNTCECQAGGTSLCTDRACDDDAGGCEYDGRMRAYAARFPATDGCNECVCAASGLACTRRCSGLPEEGAILLESMTEPCGDNPAFTGDAVWSTFPYPDLTVPFAYTTDGPMYPETLPPTILRVRVLREDEGYVVCRIPSPEQPAIDMEVTIEWITADGAFDEGFHTYLRRNDFGFVDGWFVAMSARSLHGTFDPDCLDPNGFTFGATYLVDRTAGGDIGKVCETDILLTVGAFEHTPEP